MRKIAWLSTEVERPSEVAGYGQRAPARGKLQRLSETIADKSADFIFKNRKRIAELAEGFFCPMNCRRLGLPDCARPPTSQRDWSDELLVLSDRRPLQPVPGFLEKTGHRFQNPQHGVMKVGASLPCGRRAAISMSARPALCASAADSILVPQPCARATPSHILS